MSSRELLAAAVSYATVAGRAVRSADARRGVMTELTALNGREPRAALRLRDLYATWPSAVIIRATATELLRSRWQRDPSRYDAVLAELHKQLSPMQAPTRSIVSSHSMTTSQEVQA